MKPKQPRPDKDWREVIDLADQLEGHVGAVLHKELDGLKDKVVINDLAIALSLGDVKRAMKLAGADDIEEHLKGTRSAVVKVVFKGRALGKRRIKEIRDEHPGTRP